MSRLRSGKIELTRHLVDGGDDTSTTDATDALDGLNRAWLKVTSTEDKPPPQDECTPESSVELDVWVYRMTARQYRSKREADMVDAASIDQELNQSPEPALFKSLASSTALRLVSALRALTLIPLDGSMSCQLSWLALVIASLAGFPTWASVVAAALARSTDFVVEIISALVNWFEATYESEENVSLSESDLAALWPQRAMAVARLLRSPSRSAQPPSQDRRIATAAAPPSPPAPAAQGTTPTTTTAAPRTPQQGLSPVPMWAAAGTGGSAPGTPFGRRVERLRGAGGTGIFAAVNEMPYNLQLARLQLAHDEADGRVSVGLAEVLSARAFLEEALLRVDV